MSMIGRFGWGLADQLLSSATNFLLGLLVARTVGPRDLGAFSVAYATFTFSLGAVRAIAGELLVVRHSAVSADEWRDGVKRSAGTALMAGIVVGIGCLIAGASVGEPFRTVLSIVGHLAAIPVGARRVALRLFRAGPWERRVPERSRVGCGDVCGIRAFAPLRRFFGCVVHVWVGGARDPLRRLSGCSSSRSFPAARWLPSGGFGVIAISHRAFSPNSQSAAAFRT